MRRALYLNVGKPYRKQINCGVKMREMEITYERMYEMILNQDEKYKAIPSDCPNVINIKDKYDNA